MSYLHALPLIFGILFFVVSLDSVQSKEYTRCELLHELNTKYDLPVVEAVRLTCGVRHLTDLRTDFRDVIDGNQLIGVFGIPEQIGCAQCNWTEDAATCVDAFQDDDIKDDLNCVKFLYDNVGHGIDFRNLPRYEDSSCERRIKGYVTDCFGNSRDRVIELLAPLSTTEASVKASFKWSTSPRPTTPRTTIGSRGRNKSRFRPVISTESSNELFNENSNEITTTSATPFENSSENIKSSEDVSSFTESPENKIEQNFSISNNRYEESSTVSSEVESSETVSSSTSGTSDVASTEADPEVTIGLVPFVSPPSQLLQLPFLKLTNLSLPEEAQIATISPTTRRPTSTEPCTANACHPLSSPTKQPLSTVFSFIVNNFESVLSEPCEWVTLFNKTYEFSYTDVLQWSCVGYDLIMCEREKTRNCKLNCSDNTSSFTSVIDIDRCSEISEGIDGALDMTDPRMINGTLLNGLNLCGRGRVNEAILDRYCVVDEDGLKTRPEPLSEVEIESSDGIKEMISMIMSVGESFKSITTTEVSQPETTVLPIKPETQPETTLVPVEPVVQPFENVVPENSLLDNEVPSDTCDYLISSFRVNLTAEQKISWLCYIYSTIDCRASNRDDCFTKTCADIDDYNIQNDQDCELFISYINNLVEANIEILAAIKDRPVKNCCNAAALFISDCILNKDPNGYSNLYGLIEGSTEQILTSSSSTTSVPSYSPTWSTTTTSSTTTHAPTETTTPSTTTEIHTTVSPLPSIQTPAREILLPKVALPDPSTTTSSSITLTTTSEGLLVQEFISSTTESYSSSTEISTLGTIIVPDITPKPINSLAAAVNNMQTLIKVPTRKAPATNLFNSYGTSLPEGVNMTLDTMALFKNVNATLEGNCELLQIFNSVSILSDLQVASWFCYAYDTMWCTIANGRSACNASCTSVEDRIVRYDPICEGRFNVIRKAGEQMKLLLEGNSETYNDRCRDHAKLYVVRCLQGETPNVQSTDLETLNLEANSSTAAPIQEIDLTLRSEIDQIQETQEPIVQMDLSDGVTESIEQSILTTTSEISFEESNSVELSTESIPTTIAPESITETTTSENIESNNNDLDEDPLALLEFSSLADRINLLKNLYASDDTDDKQKSDSENEVVDNVTTEQPLDLLDDIEEVSYADRINLFRHIYAAAEVDTNLIFPPDLANRNELGSTATQSSLAFEPQLLKDICQIHKALETNQDIPEVEKDSWFCFSYDTLKCFLISSENCSSACESASSIISQSSRCQPLLTHIQRLSNMLKPIYASEYQWQSCSSNSRSITVECNTLDIQVLPTNYPITATSSRSTDVSPTTYRPQLSRSTLIGAPVHEQLDEPVAQLEEANISIQPKISMDPEARSVLSSTKSSDADNNIYNLFIQNAKATSKVNFTVGLDKVLIKDIVITPNEQEKHFDVTFRLHNSAEELDDDTKDNDQIKV